MLARIAETSMATIVDGRKIAFAILNDLETRVNVIKRQGGQAALAVVMVGDHKPSQTYVRKKGESAQKIGVDFFKFVFPEKTDKETLKERLKQIQQEHQLAGMILQLPLPERLWPFTREIVNQIEIDVDVDCLSHLALGRVMMGESALIPPTPGAIMEILKYHRVELAGKEVCLVGRGDLIGKPLAAILAHEPVTLVTCGRSTPDLSHYTKTADIVITGVGKKDLLIGEMIKTGAVVIDAGVSFVGDQMYGDIDFASVSQKAGLVVPTRGGVGRITVAKLLENTVKVAESRLK